MAKTATTSRSRLSTAERDSAAVRRVAILIESSHTSARDQALGITDYVRTNGLRWKLDQEHRRLEAGPPAWLAAWRGDGIIARVYSEQTLAAIRRLGVPAVDTWQQPWARALPRVVFNEGAVARLAARHLLARGYRQFAFVGVEDVGWSELRRAGFAATIAASGFPCARFAFRRSRSSCMPPTSRSRRLAGWLRRQPLPLGIMAANDYFAAAVADACADAGIAVPEQVAIVGVNNDELVCEVTAPPLTSVALDHRRLGFEAARMLDRLMQGRSGAAELLVPPHSLVCRQSTAGRAVDDPLVAAAIDAIRSRATGPLTIDDVAAHVGVSRATLTRAFSAAIGHGVHEEIVAARLREARRLLVDKTLKLEVVARQSGFAHPEHLCRVFRQKVGVSPGEYRRSVTARQAD